MTARRRTERAAREQRIEDLAVVVLTALGERTAAERRVGEALVELTDVQGLSLSDAVRFCDAQISKREAVRLRQVVRLDNHQANQRADEPTGDQENDDDEEGGPSAGSATG
jgi:hypothetical protein